MRKLQALLMVSLVMAGLVAAAPAVAAAAGPMAPDNGGTDQPGDTGNGANLPPVKSSSFIKTLFDTCLKVANDAPDALKAAEADGWAPDEDNGGDGPFFTQIAASKSFGGIGPVEMWGTVEYYPSMREGYCRMDFTDNGGLVDFKDFPGAISGLTGQTKLIGDDIYAAWQIGKDNPTTLVIAQRVSGDVQIEINTILKAAPPPMVTEPDNMPQPESGSDTPGTTAD